MTSHELARKLLEGPDMEVLIATDFGMCQPVALVAEKGITKYGWVSNRKTVACAVTIQYAQFGWRDRFNGGA